MVLELDKRKQIELVHALERVMPPKLPIRAPEIGWSDKGVVGVRDGGDVPGVTR
jgi:hypothetical protein